MNLGSIFKRENQNISANDAVRLAEQMTKGERSYRLQSEIRGLVPGQTLQGEVVSRNGTSIQLALAGDLLLNARVNQNIDITPGQSMSFEVMSNRGGTLSLSPLYANMANEATIVRALDAAGLPETAANKEMVAKMMEEGMPIDKETIANMSRTLLEFPDRRMETLLQMTRLGLPVTEENIEQFELYRNNQHQILGAAQDLGRQLPQVLQELLAEGKGDKALVLLNQIEQIFVQDTDGTTGEEQPVIGENPTDGKESTAGQQGQTVVITEGEGQVLAQEQPLLETPEKESAQAGAKETAGKLKVTPEGEAAADGKMVIDTEKNLTGQLKELFQRVLSGKLPSATLERALESREVQKGFQELITKQWLIEPDEVAQKKEMEQLYERVREQTMRLHEAIQMADKAATPLGKSVQTMQNNVDFMNQLNHIFTYIQLPLKMAGNQAHGDLYVYTNKKNLAAKDGNVSALLHLDMEHLGPTDVYVSMQRSKVSTNFILQDESALTLIEEHIDLLDKRLMKKGYSLKAQFQIKEREEEVEQGILQTMLEQSKNISVLSKTSFDMRA